MASPLGKRRMVERKIYAEGAFGLAKELHGLRQTRFRGRHRVQIQLWLSIAAVNITKAVRNTRSSPRRLGSQRILARLKALLLTRCQLAPGTTQV